MVSVIVTTTDIFPPCIDTTTIIHRKRQQARGNDSNYKNKFYINFNVTLSLSL